MRRSNILKDETLSKNWYHLRNVTFNYTGSNGVTKTLKREVYDRGNGATILLYDPRRDSVILVRQFRVPALSQRSFRLAVWKRRPGCSTAIIRPRRSSAR